MAFNYGVVVLLITATGDTCPGEICIPFVKKDPDDLLSFYKGRNLGTRRRRTHRPKPQMQNYKMPKR